MFKGIVFLFFVGVACGQDSNDAFCRKFVQCLSDVENARAQCDKQKPTPAPAKSPQSTDECSTIGSKNDDLQALQAKQRQQHRDCLTSSFGDAVPVGDQKKLDQCQKAVANYTSNSGSRARRQAAGDGQVTSTIKPTPKPQKVNAAAAERAAAAAEKAAAAERLKQCYQDVEAKERLCRELTSCCSETAPCDLKYHLSPLHNQIYQAQLDLFNLRRRCQKKSTTNKPTTSGPTITTSVAGSG